MDFRRQLATIRKRKKITQKEIARKIGHSRIGIVRFETYRVGLSYEQLLKYVDALDCKLMIIEHGLIEREENDLDPL